MQSNLLHIFVRLTLASILGALVGLEREAHNRPAGLRTHTLVSLGSALMMLVSAYGFGDPASATHVGDPGRIAAQVVSGIGFLGAGTIMRQGSTIRGLTTAASLWVVAGIGLAVGIGYYEGALITTAMVLVSLTLFERIGNRFAEHRDHVVVIRGLDQPGILGRIGTVLGDLNVNIRTVQMESGEEGGELIIRMAIRTPSHVRPEDLTPTLAAINGVRQVEWERQ